MRRLVLTLAVGELHELLGTVTQPLMQRYAADCEADFMVLRDRTGDWSIPWEKCRIYDLLAEYDRVVFLDNDCLVRPDAPNLFECVPDTHVGVFDEGRFLPREAALREGMRQYGCPQLAWQGRYFNTGVMVASSRHRHMFRRPEVCIDNFWEQTYLNLLLTVNRYPVADIRYEMNYLPSLQEITGLPMEAAHIAHLAGQWPGMAYELGKQIIHNWDEAAPDYRFKRRVWLDFSGGLGDVIDAEPVLRYTLRNVFPDDDVRVTTPWPRVFLGNYDVPLSYGDANPFDPDGALRLQTRPPDGDGIWSTLSHVCSNACDFASISLLHQQLPIADRQIHLHVSPEDEAEVSELAGEFDLSNACLVHPGRTWASRTFPVEWWQSVVDGIAAQGVPVALCGLQGEIHGVLPVEARDGMLDLRDRTSMGALFALVARCPVLLSNDSSPVHVAGAFENAIILIPSARHPDLVLPWRHGSPYWNARALYKRLTIDDVSRQPCEYYGTHADGPPVRPWDEYLPDVSTVIESVVEMKMGTRNFVWRGEEPKAPPPAEPEPAEAPKPETKPAKKKAEATK